jgi:hypothetical protein
VKTFTQRYREFARMKRFPKWQESFARLGMKAGEDAVVFDEGAPDAWIRTAITAPPASIAPRSSTKTGLIACTGARGPKPGIESARLWLRSQVVTAAARWRIAAQCKSPRVC